VEAHLSSASARRTLTLSAACLLPVFLFLSAFWSSARASGPRWVAGSSYFDPAAKGTPLHWQNGAITYYTDLGDLSTLEPQSSANVLVAVAASAWNNVPTAAVSITRLGRLAEDVSGANVIATSSGVTMPTDMRSTATNRPVAVVYDQDGSVLNALLGAGASNPDDCRDNGVWTSVDNLATNGTIVHAVMVINGLCARDSAHITLLQYLLVRAWGRILGLDWSPANENMFTDGTLSTDGLTGWPVMHPFERLCLPAATNCIPKKVALHTDDIASVNRLYPVTAANQAAYPTKALTAANTISIQGTIRFRTGQGMQGVAVVARPYLPNTTQPDVRYTVAAVSGVLFQGNRGNIVTGPNDYQGNPLNRFGSDDESLEGWFDLSGIPLPTGLSQADYQVGLVALNRMDTGSYSVGPYTLNQVSPSGTLPNAVFCGLAAGAVIQHDFDLQDSAGDDHTGFDGTQSAVAAIPAGGEWVGRISGYGHQGWFGFWVKSNRQFTVEAQALDANGLGTTLKTRPMVGLWNATDAVGSLPTVGILQPFNGAQVGLSILRASTQSSGRVLLGIDDQRGDGRPDYLYRGRVLYADTLYPSHIARTGGAMTINGLGFRANSVVTVNGVAATVTRVTPTQILATAPAAGAGVSGFVDVVVTDPQTQGSAVLQQALSYDANSNDGLAIVTAPSGSIAMSVPQPFTVRSIASNGVTHAGLTVTFTVTSGTAALGCGQSSCAATTTADGLASVTVAATSTSQATVTAALSNGVSVQARFSGTAPPQIAALTPTLYLAQGATYTWSPQVIALSQGTPLSGVSISWSGASGASPSSGGTPTGSSGIATGQVTGGPLGSGATAQVRACLPGNVACAQMSIVSVHTETAGLTAIAGVGQTLSVSQQPAPVILRVTDAVGDPMAGATVSFYQVLRVWTPPCPSTSRCPVAAILSTSQTALTSDANGLVTLNPLTRNGIASRLSVLTTTGLQASLNFTIERHP
jgi:hypothetical protein